MPRKTPSYEDLEPASERASAAARGSSKKRGTRCEALLFEALSGAGWTFERHVEELPGKPDAVFRNERLAVFVDGDFWHGRDWPRRREKLARGNNPEYWIAKIEGNRRRDHRHDQALMAAGWTVIRVWESDIRRDARSVAGAIAEALREAAPAP